MTEFEQQILDAIRIVLTSETSNLPFNKTIQGIVIAQSRAATGEYKIQYQDGVITAYAENPTIWYDPGMVVNVLVPQNDFSQIKIITGAASMDQNVRNMTAMWYYHGEPSMDKYPANTWVTDEDKNLHLGDIYTDVDTGFNYVFSKVDGTNTYYWMMLSPSNRITAHLGRDSIILPCDSTGYIKPEDFALAGGTFVVYDGTTNITGTNVIDYNIVWDHTSYIQGRIDTSGHYEVTGMDTTAAMGAIMFSVTHRSSGIVVERSLTIVKSYSSKGEPGDAGADASAVNINLSGQIFKSTNGGISYTPNDVTAEAILQNTTMNGWQRSIDGGTTWIPITIDGSGIKTNSNKLILDASSIFFNTTSVLGIRAVTSQGLVDTVSIARLIDGINGYTVLLTNESHGFAAESNGDVLPAQYATGATEIRVFYGTEQLTCTVNAPTDASATENHYVVKSITDAVITGNTIDLSYDLPLNQFRINPSNMVGTLVVKKIIINATKNGIGSTFEKILTYTKTLEGAEGSPGMRYWIEPSAPYLVYRNDGRIDPGILGFTAYKKAGDASAELYTGKITIEKSYEDGSGYRSPQNYNSNQVILDSTALLETYNITNIAPNADFRTGSITPWNTTTQTKSSVLNNIATLEVTGSSFSYTQLINGGVTTIFPSRASHKIYMRGSFKVINKASVATGFRLEVFAGSTAASSTWSFTPQADTWYTYSDILSPPNGTGNDSIAFRVLFSSGINASGSIVQFKDLMVLDLTSVFGIGNEPSYAEVEDMLKLHNYETSFFYGTTTLSMLLRKVKAKLYKNMDATAELYDSEIVNTLIEGSPGTATISVDLSNDSHGFTADSTGGCAANDFIGSGTTIKVFEGQNLLDYTSNSSIDGSAGYWRVDVSAVNIKYRPLQDSGLYATMLDITGMDASAKTGQLIYNIKGNRANGQYFTTTAIQSFTKTNSGTDGIDGSGARLVTIIPSATSFISVDNGLNWNPNSITLTPNFQGVNYYKWQYSLDGNTWSDATAINNFSINPQTGVAILNSGQTFYTKTQPSISFKVLTVPADASASATITIPRIIQNITTFHNSYPPDPIPTSNAAGDIWFNAGDQYRMYRAAGAGVNTIDPTGWVFVQDGRIYQSILDATAARANIELLTGSDFFDPNIQIEGGKIKAGTIDVGAISVGIGNVGFTGKFKPNYSNINTEASGHLYCGSGIISLPEGNSYVAYGVNAGDFCSSPSLDASGATYWVYAEASGFVNSSGMFDITGASIKTNKTNLPVNTNFRRYFKMGIWQLAPGTGIGTLGLSLGQTFINGGDILTGTITSDSIKTGAITIGKVDNSVVDPIKDASARAFIANNNALDASGLAINIPNYLGYTSGYQELVDAAANGQTIINGGYIRTSLIQGDQLTLYSNDSITSMVEDEMSPLATSIDDLSGNINNLLDASSGWDSSLQVLQGQVATVLSQTAILRDATAGYASTVDIEKFMVFTDRGLILGNLIETEGDFIPPKVILIIESDKVGFYPGEYLVKNASGKYFYPTEAENSKAIPLAYFTETELVVSNVRAEEKNIIGSKELGKTNFRFEPRSNGNVSFIRFTN